MVELNKFYIGESVKWMRDNLPDQFIDLTITSPPYDNLRTYKGFEFDYEAMLEELYRITKDGGVVVWVVNDATVKGSETGTSVKQALYAKKIGFNLHDTQIYYKNNPMQRQESDTTNTLSICLCLVKIAQKHLTLLWKIVNIKALPI